ncbi:GtrA family protein [Aestuariivirga sp.]|uniref:GtrA family protein n=1 Tax=Aestuariivirga sp. TaxID=2650926 RepID=UPI0025BE7A94|nr:GtrA family protein [Aestuariivirga sp.]
MSGWCPALAENDGKTGLARHSLSPQIIRYALVGSFNTASSFAVYALLTWIGLPVALASFGALAFGICLSFVTLGRLVFLSTLRGRFFRFVAVWMLLYAVNLGIISLLMHFGLGPYVSGLLAAMPTVATAFMLQRIYVFR